MRVPSIPLLSLGLLGICTAGGEPARADAVRVESVGVVPAREHAPEGSIREAALRAGLSAAVLRTALDLTEEHGSWADRGAVAQALGSDPYAFTVRFRLLEDQGERPRRLLDDPTIAWEYVVLVEAHVERERVRARLAKAGLLAGRARGSAAGILRVALEGLVSYQRYGQLRDALARRARTVRPIEFARGGAVLEVETERAPGELLDALRAAIPSTLELVPLAVDTGELRLRIVDRSQKPRPAGQLGEPEPPGGRAKGLQRRGSARLGAGWPLRAHRRN